MANFPATPLPAVTELLVGGSWTDFSSRVRDTDDDPGVAITRGRSNESQRVAPSTLGLTLDNRDGALSNRLPTAAFYGLLGRNTQLRHRIRWLKDDFGRTLSDSWGSTEDATPAAWTNTGAVATEWDVNGFAGTQTHGTVNQLHNSLATAMVPVRDAAGTANWSATATGATYTTWVALASDDQNYYAALLEWTTGGAVNLEIVKRVGGSLTVLSSSVAVGSYAPGTDWSARLKVGSGGVVRAKAWQGTLAAEPSTAWTVAVTDPSPISMSTLTKVGLLSRREAGNTNVSPVCSWLQVDGCSYRFWGEVPQWPLTWETSGADVTAPIEAAGIMRRLGSSARPLRSALNRAMAGISAGDFVPIAYWPMEDGSAAMQFASAVSGLSAATVSGDFSPASYSGFPGSDPLPVLRDGQVRCELPAYSDTGRWQIQFTLMIPSSGFTNSAALVIADMLPGHTCTQIFVSYIQSTGALRLSANNSAGTTLDQTDTIAGTWQRDTPYLCAITDFVTAGSHVVALSIYQTNGSGLVQLNVFPDGIGAGSAGMPFRFTGYAYSSVASGWSLGHVALYTGDVVSTPNIGPNAQAAGGYTSELAADRMTRLCREEGIGFELTGSASDTAAMGPQRSGKLLDLLFECADADQGILYEPRDNFGLAYRTRATLYNQTGLGLDYSASQVFAPFAPTEDDQSVVNDATARRLNGSSARATVASGPLSIQDPPDGIGTYDEDRTYNVYADSQLEPIAGWRAHVGSWDEARYPQVHAMLNAPAFTASAALTAQAAAVDIGDYLAISNPPAWLPPGLIALLAQGYRETNRNFGWDITWNCTPAGPYNTGVYDTARYDSDYTTTAEVLDTTETGVDITVVAGQAGWVTTASNPAEFPFLVTIDGEDMNVTANVSTGANTYTLTVTRSVNGVVKTHAIGAAVHPKNVGYYAL